MDTSQRNIQNIAQARRLELLPYLFNQTGGRVQTGPFKGMTIVPQMSWGDGDTAAKLLGIYEDELHDWIYQEIDRSPDAVINVGCAEGYYAIGLGRLLPRARFHAIDISESAISVCRTNAIANNIHGFQYSWEGTDPVWLNHHCEFPDRPFLFIDCEGHELVLLDFNKFPNLRKSSVIVECHDCIIPGITETLISRFSNTHTIYQTKQQFKDPYQFGFLDELSDNDKWILVSEGRPESMTWLYMVPNK